MTNPNSADRTDLVTEPARQPAPDMLAELGPLAYGLIALSEPGPLTAVRPLAASRAAHVPAQAEHKSEGEASHEALLGELGELGF